MFKKVLIANRGEIAVRVIKTCKEMGIKTVAVYSDADREATQVKIADEAYHIGEAAVMKSYLNVDKIVEVAVSSGAEAIHPGYGLLSENTGFARKIKEAGIVFIGPAPESMEKMALKVESREIALKAGVPVIPGTGVIETIEEMHQEAEKIGFPLMVKASAGGGGIGMEVVNNPDQLEKAFKLAQGRAKAYFANPAVYLEKYVEAPRHIEVQILCDRHGNYLHLGERECSIQRRHQKVVEESPSVALSPEKRAEITQAALKLAKAVDYENAGTVEFIFSDKTQDFYFLEMNTRLQVEHPVTEMVTGLDLVCEQLKIANGEKISFSQEQVNFKGQAIECRLYAEDPVTFMPSPGTITGLNLPEMENLRIDTGIYENYVVTPFYDPMLAKIIAWGETRTEAIKTLLNAFEKMKIEGIKTNLELLKKIIASEAFAQGKTTTDFIQKYLN